MLKKKMAAILLGAVLVMVEMALLLSFGWVLNLLLEINEKNG